MPRKKKYPFEPDRIIRLSKDLLFTSDGDVLPETAKGYIMKEIGRRVWLVHFHPRYGANSNHEVNEDCMVATNHMFDIMNKDMYYEYHPSFTVSQKYTTIIQDCFERLNGDWKPMLGEADIMLRLLYDYENFVMDHLRPILDLMVEGKTVAAYKHLECIDKFIRPADFMHSDLHYAELPAVVKDGRAYQALLRAEAED